MTKERISLGKWGEEQAADYLLYKRYKIVERNFTCRMGEIDIIARDNERLIFVEVKTKQGFYHPLPRFSVNRRKQQQISRVAQYYLKQNRRPVERCRFDVIEVIAGPNRRLENILHLPGAFRVPV